MQTKELIKWMPELSVGVTELDEQHKKLITLLNKLYSSIKAGSSSKILENILEELTNYTKYHFENEEKYFTRFNYKDTKEHIKEHKKFINKIKSLLEKKDSSLVSLELLKFLTNWVSNHIVKEDKKYTSCFNNNGLY
jgi:hemerythrin-like metal-binding protein